MTPEARSADSRPQRGRTKARNPKPGTAREDTTGAELERRVARIEFAEGAFVRLRVPVRTSDGGAGRDVLTDVDVLSIDVDLRLRVDRSSAECKSGAGYSGEPSTIVWLAGFRELLSLDRVALVRTSVSPRGRALAKRLRIGVLDEAAIRVREKAHAWVPERFAHLDGAACIAAERRTDAQLRGLPAIPQDVANFLRADALFAGSAPLLAGVESYGRAVHEQGMVPDPAAQVLAGHALIAVILAALQDASRLDELTLGELSERLAVELVGADASTMKLLARADNVVGYLVGRVHRAYVDAGAEPVEQPLPSLRDTVAAPPAYLAGYLDLVERMRANTLVARDLLQTAELACFDALVGDTAWQSDAFAHLFSAEHKGLLLVALRTLEEIAGATVSGALAPLYRLPVVAGHGEVPDRQSTAGAGRTTSATQPRGRYVPNTSGATQATLDGMDEEVR